jgi:sulfoxide reductase heme-binding subunit YedZ
MPDPVILLKAAMWIACLAPAAWLGAGFFLGWLGVNPIEKLTRVTGLTALVLLLVTLGVSPARRLTGWNPLIKLRRPLGLFAFFYASLHFLVWMGLDLTFELAWVWEDIVDRPYITVGFVAFLLLVPLAVTSTRGWIRRLGKRWTLLHRLSYLATALALVHFYWLVKADVRLPLTLAAVFALLMAARLQRWWSRRSRPGRTRNRKRAAEAGP